MPCPLEKKLKLYWWGQASVEPHSGVRPWYRIFLTFWNLSVSAILLLTFGGFKLIEAIIEDPAIDKTLKAGLLFGIAAIAILLVSVLRERLHIRKKDRYKDVRR